MSISAGTYTLGPDNAELLVRTGRTGAAAKAGHNLVIEVTSWKATLAVGADAAQTTAELHADGGSLRVREGTGGIQPLGDSDKETISETIDNEVLGRTPIDFRSTSAEPAGPSVSIQGELELRGRRHPVAFELAEQDGHLTASTVIRQSDFGMKPYSTLFGTLKVADEIEITFAGRL